MRSNRNIGVNVVWYDDEWYARMAARIRAARRKVGWTLEYMAGQIGVNVSDLQKLETHKLEIRLHHLRAVSRVLGVPMAELVDTSVEDPAHVVSVLPPPPEPWVERITNVDERKLVRLFRKLRRREKLIVRLLAESIVALRAPKLVRPHMRTMLDQIRDVALAASAAGRNPHCIKKRCHCHVHLGRLSDALEDAHQAVKKATAEAEAATAVPAAGDSGGPPKAA